MLALLAGQRGPPNALRVLRARMPVGWTHGFSLRAGTVVGWLVKSSTDKKYGDITTIYIYVTGGVDHH